MKSFILRDKKYCMCVLIYTSITEIPLTNLSGYIGSMKALLCGKPSLNVQVYTSTLPFNINQDISNT